MIFCRLVVVGMGGEGGLCSGENVNVYLYIDIYIKENISGGR